LQTYFGYELAPSSQTVGSLSRTHCPEKKNIFYNLANVFFLEI
jgi:hypothetical protein